jgi:DnaJ-class molecular chaperone
MMPSILAATVALGDQRDAMGRAERRVARPCEACNGTGLIGRPDSKGGPVSCGECRGKGWTWQEEKYLLFEDELYESA